MNKSKFLKRSLATLLAILLVVAMVPMSALAEDDDTSTAPAAPEYTVVVNNREAAFKDGGFDATVYSTYILSVALYGLPEGVKVDLLTKNGNVVPLTSTTAVDLKQEATLVSETERTSLYNIKLRETKGGESKEYTLAVTVENVVPVDNVDIKSVRTEEGDVIDSIIGENEITLILPLGYTKDDIKTENKGILDKDAFVPANYNATVTLNGKETITVKAADNSSKTYKINYTHETGFTSFTVPNQVGETEMSDDGLNISIKVPKASTPGDNLKKIVPTWTTNENVQVVYSKGAKENVTSPATREELATVTGTELSRNCYGVVSGRGEYDFSSGDHTITFFVRTKATNEMKPDATAAAVNVTITETDKYVGTGIENFTITVLKKNEDGSTTRVPLSTVYDVTANNTVYMPAGYGFLAGDEVEVEVNVDKGATAQIVSQNNPQTDPVTVTESGTFTKVRTNGRMFTIQVKAEDENVAAANYRVNLIAASSSQADLSNNSGLRFQIGGDDGKSMAATFDRQNVTNGQYDMTIKVPFGTLKQRAGTAAYVSKVSGTPGTNVIFDTLENAGTYNNTVSFDTLDPDVLKNLIHSGFGTSTTWNGSKIGLKFYDDNGDGKALLVLFKDKENTQDIMSGVAFVDGTGNATLTLTEGTYAVGTVTVTLGYANWDSGDLFTNPDTLADGWTVFEKIDNDVILDSSDDEKFCIVDTGLRYNVGETPYEIETGAGKFGDNAVYALVSPGASAYYDWNGTTGTPIQSSITKFEDIWDTAVAYEGTHGVFSIHVEQNETKKDYRIKLVEEDARTGNKITEPATIADDNVIGEGNEFVGTPVEKGGNDSLLKVGVGYEWKNKAGDIPATTYIYNGLNLSDGAKAYIFDTSASKFVEVATTADGSLDNADIKSQSSVEELNVGADDILENGRTPVVKSLTEKIYVISEAEMARFKATTADWEATIGAGGAVDSANVGIVDKYAHVYNVYYERGTANNQAQLLTVGSSTPGVRATLDYTKTVNVRVPNSFNWSTYRDNGECDFTIDFTVSDGASLSDNAYGTWAAGKTNFFVKDSELYVFDKLTGRKTQITNKGEYEPQAAMLTVTSQNRKVSNTYPFRLTIAQPESNNKLKKVVVGETEAAINGSDVTVTLPAGSELNAQDVFITPDSDVATVQNEKGEAFDSTVKHDLSEPMKFTITAEDGTKAEYTLTAKVGGSVVDPDKKPSDSYTDLDKVTNETMRNKVKAAIDMGIMGSTSTTSFVFAPKAEIGRKDIAVIIARADLIASNDTIADKDQADEALKAMYTDGETAFDDLTKCNAIQKAAIRYCSEKDIISGDGKGGFAPDGKLTREAIAVILTNWTKIEVDKNNTENVNKIADWSNVSNWAKPYVNAVYGKLMNGTGTGFNPKGIVNREQTASVLVDAFGIIYPEFGN